MNTTTERSRWLKLVKESIIGLAPYEDNATTYKRFSDVTKPKDYMSCGLPIVTTKVIPLSEDVRRFNLGRVVEYEVPSFVEGVTEFTVSAWMKSDVSSKSVNSPVVSQEGPSTDTFLLYWDSSANVQKARGHRGQVRR